MRRMACQTQGLDPFASGMQQHVVDLRSRAVAGVPGAYVHVAPKGALIWQKFFVFSTTIP